MAEEMQWADGARESSSGASASQRVFPTHIPRTFIALRVERKRSNECQCIIAEGQLSTNLGQREQSVHLTSIAGTRNIAKLENENKYIIPCILKA